MKSLLTLVLFAASSAFASMELDTSYTLPNGAHKTAKLFLVDRDLNGSQWIALPEAKALGKRYRVKIRATKMEDDRVKLNFSVAERHGLHDTVLAKPSVTTRLGHSAELQQKNKDGSLMFRLKVTPSDLEG